MDEVNEFSSSKVKLFDEWMKFKTFTFTKKFKNKTRLARLIALEKDVLNQVQTVVIAEALQRKDYLIDLLQIKKLITICAELIVNYDPANPTAFDDLDVLNQLHESIFVVDEGQSLKK